MGNNKANKNNSNPKPKRPPLTHFLCLPLVNAVSLPQLESSLALFKASLPSVSPTSPDQEHQEQAGGEQVHQQPLIPDGAIRPVGTLHLTLGVMSLPTQARLNEALQFFGSLDLVALLRNAEEVAAQKRTRSTQPRQDIANDPSILAEEPLKPAVAGGRLEASSETTKPFNVSLESMHVLPRARSATVLHAAPVDPTSRLYPFCEALRDKFLEAGFLQGEYKEDPKTKKKQDSKAQVEQQEDQPLEEQPVTTEQSANTLTKQEPSLLEEMPTELAEETTQRSRSQVVTVPSQEYTARAEKGKRKPRPLLLHATIVNTIYIKGRKRNASGQGKGKRNFRNERYTFDARDILSHYRNFYQDSARTVPRVSDGVVAQRVAETSGENNVGAAGTEADANMQKDTGYPFVWARDFPIDTVCICEMGAKKLDLNADESGMNARLGEKYAVVAERSLESQVVETQSGGEISA